MQACTKNCSKLPTLRKKAKFRVVLHSSLNTTYENIWGGGDVSIQWQNDYKCVIIGSMNARQRNDAFWVACHLVVSPKTPRDPPGQLRCHRKLRKFVSWIFDLKDKNFWRLQAMQIAEFGAWEKMPCNQTDIHFLPQMLKFRSYINDETPLLKWLP